MIEQTVKVKNFDESNVPVLNEVLDKLHREAAKDIGFINVKKCKKIYIAGGVIKVTQSFHTIAVETGASDDVDTINGGSDGDIIVLEANSSAADVVIKDGTGNINCAGDFTMDNIEDKIVLIKKGTGTATPVWQELTRSNNGA